MHPLRLLNKATPKSQSLDIGTGNRNALTGVDAAHSIAHLKDPYDSFALWLIGHEDKIQAVKVRLVVVARKYVRDNGLRFRDKTVLKTVVAALYQYRMPVCLECDGKGTVPRRLINNDGLAETKPFLCTKCSGERKKPVKLAEIARILEVRSQSITDKHIDLINELVGVLNRWERKVLNHVRERAELE